MHRVRLRTALKAPPRKHVTRASVYDRRAAEVTRMLERAATHMAVYPDIAEHTAPKPKPTAATIPSTALPREDAPVAFAPSSAGRN
mmetsp:Transcript_9163/g.13570  ORF Transcript_9163/g.13570 Transcript_9163/m.13570 type:complete len:86 (+) Transcript_9163:332-589(+)